MFLNALNLLQTAKAFQSSNSGQIYKQEALVLARLDRNTEAISALNSYIEILNSNLKNLEEIKNEKLWLRYFTYYKSEIDWASNLNGILSKL